MSPRHVLAVAWLCLAGYGNAAEQVSVLPTFDVAPSNINSFNTPVAYWQGDVYTANVEPGMGMPGIHLKTVVRKCALGNAASCTWESKVVDDATLDDMYHTQPSIAVDRAGYVHVAYNMHHMPWQYSVSTRPGDISTFNFMGEPITSAQKALVKLANQTPFFSIGKAAIAGNQITYPAFYYDQNRDLYVTYRYSPPARNSPLLTGHMREASPPMMSSKNNGLRSEAILPFARLKPSCRIKQSRLC